MAVKKLDDLESLYQIEKTLGKGSFGEVVQAVHLKSKEARAIKIIKKSRIQEKKSLIVLMMQEIGVLMQNDHPNLMKVHEIVEDDLNYYIISELLTGGELYYKIVQMKVFTEQDAAHIIKQILLGLNYMHSKNVMHRDIKPENILIEKDLEVKITDFGFA